jgi:hypothetical protein
VMLYIAEGCHSAAVLVYPRVEGEWMGNSQELCVALIVCCFTDVCTRHLSQHKQVLAGSPPTTHILEPAPIAALRAFWQDLTA